MPDRFTVRSEDGVEISVQKTGSGPALLLIHGALLNGTLSWGAVLPKFAEHFTVYAMDRRGRAPSGDAKQYSIANEADDIVAAVAAIGGPVVLLSHSYGALASIEALDRLKSVSHLLLYEPPLTLHPFESDVVTRMERALQANDREALVTTFLRDQVRVPMERFDAMKSSPIWPIVLDISPTLPRESHEVNTYKVSAERLASCEIPTTVLLGSETVGLMRDAAFFLREVIPDCRLTVLEGQGHGAMLDAPDFFAAKVIELIAAPSRSSSHTAG
ncbi:MAG TPA: alpha/beta hydrolase [Bryobacteraceae bacterium]|nr:alpha/beta hydrolase [Bryobacteraceae bacterium]